MTLFVIFGCWQSGINELDLGVSGDIVKKIYVYPVATWVGLAVCNYWMPPGVNSSIADCYV